MPSDGQVPDGWRVVRLGDVAGVTMGQSPPGAMVLDWDGNTCDAEGLPFIQGNAEFGAKFPTPLKWCIRPLKVAEPDDILISVRAPVGQTNRSRETIGIGRGLAAIRFAEFPKNFGWHVINHAKEALERVTQGSTFQAIGGEQLRNLRVPSPPLLEQRAIAGVLDAIDEAIERTEAVIAATERLRDSLLHELLTRGVPGSNVKTLADAPLEIIDGDRGKNYPKQRDFSESGDCLFLNTANVTTAGFSFSSRAFISSDRDQRLGKGKLVRDDVVLTTRGTVGNSAHFDGSVSYDNLRINSGMVILRPSKHDLYPGYLYAFVRSQVFLSQVNAFRTGSAQPQLPIRVMERIKIALPPLCEQRAIAGALGAIDAAIVARASELDRLQATKASTSDALLRGRLRMMSAKEAGNDGNRSSTHQD